jgi:hypothetical protein
MGKPTSDKKRGGGARPKRGAASSKRARGAGGGYRDIYDAGDESSNSAAGAREGTALPTGRNAAGEGYALPAGWDGDESVEGDSDAATTQGSGKRWVCR